MDKASRDLIVAAARAAKLPKEKITAMLAATEDDQLANKERPALLTQAQKARQLGVSRFTVRKLTQIGKLSPVELLPGLLRYRADELVKE